MTADPLRLHRLTVLRHNALCHVFDVPRHTPAADIRGERARRVCAAYWAERERFNVSRARRLAAYYRRRDRGEMGSAEGEL